MQLDRPLTLLLSGSELGEENQNVLDAYRVVVSRRAPLHGSSWICARAGLTRAQQSIKAGEGFGGKSHRPFELIVTLQHIWMTLPLAKGFPIEAAFEPGPLPVHANRKV